MERLPVHSSAFVFDSPIQPVRFVVSFCHLYFTAETNEVSQADVMLIAFPFATMLPLSGRFTLTVGALFLFTIVIFILSEFVENL
jgi:hypothetical protein